jgi:class 3 adenylate cyclase/signal transduction histidine kinase
VRAHTIALWCSFPLIVLFEMACPQRLLAAETMYACADLGAKAVWAALLMQGNALVAESQRRRSREYLADVATAELVARLRAALTLRDRLRAAASHELRTPLNSACPPGRHLLYCSVANPGSFCVAVIVGLADKVLSASSTPGGPPPPSPRVSTPAMMTGNGRMSHPRMSSSTAAPRVSGGASGVESQRALAAIKAAGVRLLALVEDLADDASSSIAPRRLHLACELISVSELVAEVMPLHEGLQRPGVRLINKVVGGDACMLPPLYADRVRLTHALHRLLATACRDTVAGTITVSAEVLRAESPPSYAEDGADSDEGGAAAEVEQAVIAIHVTDSGAGGCASALASSASSAEAAADAEAGVGLLGLQGVTETAEAHGGTLLIVPTPGVGTRATLALPLVPQRCESPSFGVRCSGEGRSSSDGGRGSLDGRRSGDARRSGDPRAMPLSPQMQLGGSASPPDPATTAAEAAARSLAKASGDEQLEWLELGAAASSLPLVLCVGGVSGQAELATLLSGTFTVRCSRTAEAALGALADGEARRVWPDAVLLHASAGGAAMERLRDACPPNTPSPAFMVLLEEGAEDGSAADWLEAGAADVLRTPLSRDLLAVRITTQLRLRTAAHEAATSGELLRRMLPEGVISRLMSGQQMIAESMENITVLFSDVVSFTSLASQVPTTELIIMLNELFSRFDALCDKYGCYKVETIGDAYMVVSGNDDAPNHAARMLALATEMLEVSRCIRLPRASVRTLAASSHLALPSAGPRPAMDAEEEAWGGAMAAGHIRLRIGVHCGPAFAGVVGTKMPHFSFFGDTINTASRMESTGYPMAIQLSESALAAALAQGACPGVGHRSPSTCADAIHSASRRCARGALCAVRRARREGQGHAAHLPLLRGRLGGGAAGRHAGGCQAGRRRRSDAARARTHAAQQHLHAALEQQRSAGAAARLSAHSTQRAEAAAAMFARVSLAPDAHPGRGRPRGGRALRRAEGSVARTCVHACLFRIEVRTRELRRARTCVDAVDTHRRSPR